MTQRTAKLADQAADDEGTIDTFVVNADGTLGRQQTFDVTGQGPCGFTFNSAGVLLTTEQFDGTAGSALGAAAGYQVADDGTLTPSSPSVGNGGTDTCWFVVNDDGTVGFTTSFYAEGRISSYAVGADGSLELLQADADPDVHNGASDLSLSGDSRYLYQLNALEGTISAFAVGRTAHSSGSTPNRRTSPARWLPSSDLPPPERVTPTPRCQSVRTIARGASVLHRWER